MFDWKEEFSVGIKKFDDQHKHLLEIGKELYYLFENVEKGIDQYDQILELLQEMHDYTVYHFDSEEKAMEKYNYPRLEEHRKAHQGFVEKLKEIDLDDVDTEQRQFSMELLDFIANWVENHILGEDQKYSPFLQGKELE
ncbi:MAG: bacteriohemerythrin [Halanaerobiales bacterium]